MPYPRFKTVLESTSQEEAQMSLGLRHSCSRLNALPLSLSLNCLAWQIKSDWIILYQIFEFISGLSESNVQLTNLQIKLDPTWKQIWVHFARCLLGTPIFTFVALSLPLTNWTTEKVNMKQQQGGNAQTVENFLCNCK